MSSSCTKYIVKILFWSRENYIQMTSEQPSKVFLSTRKLLDVTSSDFGININSNKLESSIKNLHGEEKPFVLFSSCPKFLLKKLPVNSKEYADWLNTKGRIKIKGNDTMFLSGHSKRTDMDDVTYEFNNHGKIMRYLELNQNGFVEQGITSPIIYDDNYGNSVIPVLNLYSVTGSFWAFALFCKQYYDFIKFDGEIDIRLSVHNSKELMLKGFGGITDATGSSRWLEPNSRWWYKVNLPRTTHQNISLVIDNVKTDKLTEDYIESRIREISNKLSNAYGLKSARCYNFDGSFNFNSDRGAFDIF
jgi:hypothetical protein